MTDPNWLPVRVRRNFRIDLFSALGAGAFVSVLVAFMPIVVRRMGGSTTDVAIVVAGPFIGNLLSPVFSYLTGHLPLVRAVAGASTLSRAFFLISVLIAVTPFALAVTSAVFWIIAISNIAAYTTLMQAIYPDRERAFAMGNVRVGAAVAGIAAAALAGSFIDVIPAQWVFAAAALVGLPCAASFFAIRYDGPATPPARRPAATIAREVWADLRYRKLLLAFTIFGTGNLMNFAVFPILLVDHFDAPSSFIGTIVAYPIVGRLIDRGSTLRLTMIATLLTILVPIGYLTAPNAWALVPVAVIIGVGVSTGELTGFTNIVHMAPRDRIREYAAAQALLLGVRGTASPFIAAALLGMVAPQVVLVLGTLLMTTGALVLAQVVRAPVSRRIEVVPAEA